MKKALGSFLLAVSLYAGQLIANATPIIPEHNAAFRRYLPNLYQALRQHNANGMGLIEYFDHLIQATDKNTTWALSLDQQHFMGDVLQILDTIASEQAGQTRATILIQGNPGTLPLLLLSAGLFKLGKQDIALQLVGDETHSAIRQFNRIIRHLVLTHDTRFHIKRFSSAAAFKQASQRNLRHATTVIIFDNKQEVSQLVPGKPLVFNFVKRIVN